MNSYDRIYSLLLEWKGDNPVGKFTKKSPLTPQHHGMEGVASNKETRRNFEAMKAAIKSAKEQNKDIAYGREGNVKGLRLEKLARAYALRQARGGKKASRAMVRAGKTKEKLKGWQGTVKGFNLEHPDYDPMIKGNKGERLAARKHGKKAARRGTRVGFVRSGTKKRVAKKYNKEAYAEEDFGKKRPTKSELVQRDRNRLRRRGAARKVSDQEKKGRVVIGPYGASHWRDED